MRLSPKPVTVNTLRHMKSEAQKITCLTAYDAGFAHVLDEAGIDVVLVGDSLGMVIQGHDTTIPVTMDDMLYHTRCVARGLDRALLMADMPFMSYTDPDVALLNAGKLLQEGGAHMVKLEGNSRQADVVSRLSQEGIPVCAHLGLRPQFVHKLGGYRMQGTDGPSAESMRRDASVLVDAGADLLLLECVPASLSEEITRDVPLPVIGIGAGPGCDGQILVLQDILGITPGRTPGFAKNFLTGQQGIPDAVQAYVLAVRDGTFPSGS
ncbi:MAG: 3-methyl-2-oxobutanoate hydroxymethyltransferase [Pseudomonadota bacterium]|nr:3-methyl-2-oxobutanoate hydroxymethyltransferase [Pseudomonadota bacterium]